MGKQKHGQQQKQHENSSGSGKHSGSNKNKFDVLNEKYNGKKKVRTQ